MADERSVTSSQPIERKPTVPTVPTERPISGEPQEGEVKIDHALRPRSLKEMIGQERLRDKMEILVSAAKQRGDVLDHVLLYGPPGLGKTTLSHIMAVEMNANLKVTAGPAIEKAGDLAAILTNLRKGDVLFIDEIHRLGRAVEEILYPAMEDFALDIVDLAERCIKRCRFSRTRWPGHQHDSVRHLQHLIEDRAIARRHAKMLGAHQC